MENANLPDNIKSIWSSFSPKTSFSQLTSKISTEIVIIGGGITGITTAQLLKESGHRVIVLEAKKIGGGDTGHSTGNLYVAVEEGFDHIKNKYDTETLKTVIAARAQAIALIEQNVARFSIDCDFKRVNWYSYSATAENDEKIQKILKAGLDADAPIFEVQPGELPLKFSSGVKMPNQAQFNPLLYVQQLGKAIHGQDCQIYENSQVMSITEEDDQYVLETEQGEVRAKYLIHASHTPKGVMLDFHSLLGTYREYGIAARIAGGDIPEGTFWGYYQNKEKYSVRTYQHDGEKRIVVVGQPHEVGQKENNVENIENLEKFLREHFDVGEITNRWGGQNYKSADGLPYIGRQTKGKNAFIATGFATDGLTYGTLSAIILRDILTNKETEFTKLFDATRHNPIKAAGDFIKENALNAAQAFKDYVLFKDSKISEIPAEEGRVVEVDGKKLAVFHGQSGEIRACSAICTHLGCVVHWNRAEKTWDCPCHASRFNVDGRVIEGPALKNLQTYDVREKD